MDPERQVLIAKHRDITKLPGYIKELKKDGKPYTIKEMQMIYLDKLLEKW